MNKYIVGFISGFVATVILSVLMIMKAKIGLMPQFNVIRDFTLFFGATTPMVGWILHFILGTFLWGGIFAFLVSSLQGAFWLRGVLFGIGAWLLMMVAFMPVMQHGFFAIQLGFPVVIATLVLHLIYGFFLGLIYGWLPKID